MKTSAISNPANIATGSPSATKQPDAAIDTPFGQVLSREMAARPAPSEPARIAAGKGNEAKQAARAETARSKAEPAQESAETTPAAAEASTTVDDGSAQAGTDATDADADASLSTASADLLALVVSLTQQAPARTDSSAAADAQAAAATPTDAAALLVPTAAQDAALAAAPVDAEGRGQEIASLAGALRPNSRAKADAAGARNITADGKQVDAGLAAAGNDKPATEAGSAKASPTEFAAQPALRDAAAAKTPIDGAAPINIAGPAQAQPLQHAQATPAPMADRLAPRVGTPAWDQALGQKVVWMVGGELQSASLTLNPPELGPLQVVLNVANSQATANFTAAQPEVRQALEAAMPKLREMLGEAGIELSQASVSAGMPNDPKNAFERPQQGQGTQRADARNDDADNAAPIVRSQPITGGQGLVDTFA